MISNIDFIMNLPVLKALMGNDRLTCRERCFIAKEVIKALTTDEVPAEELNLSSHDLSHVFRWDSTIQGDSFWRAWNKYITDETNVIPSRHYEP